MALEKVKDFFRNISSKGIDGTEDEYYEEDTDLTGNKMILLEPRAFSECQQIADQLKTRNSVVVNLKRVTSSQAKRIIDFLSGCIYAIGGKMEKISIGVYLCTPNNIAVEGKITEDSNSKDKDNIDEEVEW